MLERTGSEYSAKIQSGFYNILDIITLFIRLGGLFFILAISSPLTAFLTILFCIPIYYLAKKNGEKIYTAYENAVPHRRRSNYFLQVLSDRFYTSERILFNHYSEIAKRFNNEYDTYIKVNFTADKKSFTDAKLLSICFTLFVIVAAFIMLIPLLNGKLSTGTYTAIMIALANMIHSLSWQLQEILLAFQENKIYLRDLNSFYQLKKIDGINSVPNLSILKEKFRLLEFKNVSFSYPNTDNLILNNFSLKIFPNKQSAFVGKNGCGKSTIVKLLAGLYDGFYSGEILLNEKNITEYTYPERKAHFSILFQDYARYQLTAQEQINIVDKDADIKRIEEVFTQTDILKKINSFELKTFTTLGKLEKNSETLSKGQWQRIALSRAFAKQANVFIFDEPTASLDPFAESEMYKIIRNYSVQKNMTTVYITHRLAATRLADKIIVMDNGSVIENGTHDELIQKNGLYCKMFENQKSWYDDSTPHKSYFADDDLDSLNNSESSNV